MLGYRIGPDAALARAQWFRENGEPREESRASRLLDAQEKLVRCLRELRQERERFSALPMRRLPVDKREAVLAYYAGEIARREEELSDLRLRLEELGFTPDD